MTFELRLLPSGHLHCDPQADNTALLSSHETIIKAFAKNSAEGFFALIALADANELAPSVCFWRDVACRYMSERCHTPQAASKNLEPIEFVPGDAESELLFSAPPMLGAEYLSTDILAQVWNELDTWLCLQVNNAGGNLPDFLSKRAPRWRQVGRVCFHLAENKTDPNYPFAFLVTYTPQFTDYGKVQHQPLGKALQEYAGTKNTKALINLLAPVQRASEVSTLIKELVDSGDIYHPLPWTPAETHRFLRESFLYEDCGIIVRLPDWWKKRSRPAISISIGNDIKSTFTANAMLDFKVTLTVDGDILSESEWNQLMTADDGLIFLKGQWIEVDKARLQQALDHWQQLQKDYEHNGIPFIEGMRLLAGATANLTDQIDDAEQDWSFVNSGPALKKILTSLKDPKAIPNQNPGKALKTALRPYQTVGVNWLAFLSHIGLGACLADDMGLGKTIQIIALLLLLKKSRIGTPSLLVLPASLLNNWQDEINKFAPSLRYVFVHPSQANKTQLDAMSKGEFLADQDIVLTSYGMLLRQPWLLEKKWHLVILDEAQAIKNPNARQTKAVGRLQAQSRIALTGTPVENKLADLWSLFNFLCPGLLGTAKTFKHFTTSLAERPQGQYAPLRKLVGPYILRRLKTDKSIITDLPDKTEIKAYCGLSKEQIVLYKKSVIQLAADLKGLDGIKRRGLVLAYILRFKQICNHPSHFLGDGLYQATASGKFIRLAEICEEIASRQEKALIFTQFQAITGPLNAFLTDCFKRPGLVLTGQTPVKKRKTLVNQFQQEDQAPFFVLSIKAGGTGLNLTAAAHVIHFDRWWNPAVENQATDRAFRIGQKRNVLVHKFICQGTIEEKIDAMITAKTALANDILAGDQSALLTEMSDSELIDMVRLDIEQMQP